MGTNKISIEFKTVRYNLDKIFTKLVPSIESQEQGN